MSYNVTPEMMQENVPVSKLKAVEFVLRERERELLILKGPCSNKSCGLHYAHSGPCS